MFSNETKKNWLTAKILKFSDDVPPFCNAIKLLQRKKHFYTVPHG